MIVSAETLQDQAATFIGINSDRLAVTKTQMHAAAVVAGDPDAIRVQSILDRLEISKSCPNKSQAYHPRETSLLAAIRPWVDRCGEKQAETILRVLADAECAPIKEVGLKAVERLAVRSRVHRPVDAADLVVTVAATRDTAEKDGRVFAATHSIPWWHGLAAVWFRKVKKARLRDARSAGPAAPVASAETDSKPDRTPEKGTYQAPAPSTARPLRDRDSIDAKPLVRRTVPVTAAICGDPPPGRSALDQKRAVQ